MNRLEYWKHIAESIMPIDKNVWGKVDRRDREAVITQAIEKGLAYIVIDNIPEAQKYFQLADSLFIKKSDFSSLYLYHLYQCIIHSLLEKIYDYNFRNIIEAKEVEIRKETMHFEIKDIANSLERCKLSIEPIGIQENDEDNYSTIGFEETSSDYYYYQVLGNNQLELAWFYILANYYYNADVYLNEARCNLNLALEKIPHTLAEEKPQWEKFKSLPTEEVLEKFPDEKEYIEARNELKGNIPFYLQQVKLLKMICDYFRDSSIVKKEQIIKIEQTADKLLKNNETINNRLSLSDELILLFILYRFQKQEGRRMQLYDFLRMKLL